MTGRRIDQAPSALEEVRLAAMPYEDDPDLSWEAPPGPDLPYDGDVPADVLALAEQRHRISDHGGPSPAGPRRA